MKTLGICIPTFKRPEFLKRCLYSAVAAAEGRPIKIFIADDSTTLINKDIIEKFTNDFSEIVSSYNEINLGIDSNIQKSLEMCDCDYGWLIGEDDTFFPGSIAAVYDLIQDIDAPFIFSAYKYVADDQSLALSEVTAGEGNCWIPTAEFIKKYLWAIGFIGSVIVRTKEWKTTQPETYNGTYFTHVGRILEILAEQETVYVSNNIAVGNRAQGRDTFTWKADSFGVFLGFEKMCALAAERNNASKQNIRAGCARYRSKFAYFSIKTTLRLRAEGALDFRQFQRYIRRLSDISLTRKCWILLLCMIPTLCFVPIVNVYSKYQRKIKLL